MCIWNVLEELTLQRKEMFNNKKPMPLPRDFSISWHKGNKFHHEQIRLRHSIHTLF